MHNTRLYTSRIEAYQYTGMSIVEEAQTILSLNSIQNCTVHHVFDFENIDTQEKETIISYFKNDLNEVSFVSPLNSQPHFHIKAVEGQFDDVLDRVETHLKTFYNITSKIDHSLLFIFDEANFEEVEMFKNYYVNEKEYVDFDTKYVVEDTTSELLKIEGFIDFDEDGLLDFKQNLGMDIDDLQVVQDYFKKENRNPSMTELKIIDTYWSDHCRHTTFLTHFDTVEIDDERVQKAYDSYIETRDVVYTEKIKPQTLMDIATINAKEIAKKGLLEDWDQSKEVNAVSLNVDIDVNGQKEGWQLLFKNETHNHPTEVEPYGGASTCFGGCVRDPLSGRGTVYQGMRISGSKNPLTTFEDTRKDKLMARQISQKASEGYSDYANQMGIKAGYIQEVYHDGYEAKRLELGALVAAVPQKFVVKLEPQKGDVVLLLGGETGRDGLGAAVGSSSTQTKSSLKTVGAEVQKGNPLEEHKITRLFRKDKVLSAIKRCNDFGAGGVSVAVGELADSIQIELDQVHLKYDMHPGEIALSESQERMAVVIDQKDVEMFITECHKEDVPVSQIATITDNHKMVMLYEGEVVVELDRAFLDSNGAIKKTQVHVAAQSLNLEKKAYSKETLLDLISNVHGASRRGLKEKFNHFTDEHIDLRIDQESMTHPFPVSGTQDISFMSAGFPILYEEDSYLHGVYSVIEAVSRLVASGANPENARLSMQEYFERLTTDTKWGKPFASLLGAFEVMKAFDLPALGGKDSMSGSYEDLHVPGTLITFAVQTGKQSDIITRGLKGKDHKLVLIKPIYREDASLNLEETRNQYNEIHKLMQDKKVYSASTATKSLFGSLFEMSLGSDFGLYLIENEALVDAHYGALILEVDKDFELGEDLGYTTSEDTVKVGAFVFDKDFLQEKHESTLDSVYPRLQTEKCDVEVDETETQFVKRVEPLKACLLIMEETANDLSLENKLIEANIDFETVVIKTHDFENSAEEFVRVLERCNALFLGHGSTKDMETVISGYETKLFLTHSLVKEAFENFVSQDKLVVGLGSGVLTLAQMNLLGEVEIMPIGKHMVNLETVVSKASVGFQEKNKIYTLPYITCFAFKKVESEYAILQTKHTPLGASNITGLQKDSVMGLLGAIDQINSDFFRNLNTDKEEI